MRDTKSCERLLWNDSYLPRSEETVLIRAAIVERGLRTRADVANAVAEELWRRDCRGASSLDGFGIFRHWYVADIRRLLDRLEGSALTIERAP